MVHPNVVTGARFALAAAGRVSSPRSPDGAAWLLGVLVTVALLPDLVDGRLARRPARPRSSAPGSTRRPTRS